MDILEALAAFHGAARLNDLALTSAGRRALRRAVAAGTVESRFGCFSLPETSRHVVRARALRGVLTCTTAAEILGLPVLVTDRRSHVAVPRNRGVARSDARAAVGVVLHREPNLRILPPHEAPLVPPSEVIARVLRCLDEKAAVVTTDAALHRGLVTVEEVANRLRGPGSAAARRALARCDGRSMSAIESLARLALRGAGWDVDVNVHVPGVGTVDLVVQGFIVVELDGFAYHSGRREFSNDRRRDRELAALGYVTLRFVAEDVVGDAQVVVRSVRAVLARGSLAE